MLIRSYVSVTVVIRASGSRPSRRSVRSVRAESLPPLQERAKGVRGGQSGGAALGSELCEGRGCRGVCPDMKLLGPADTKPATFARSCGTLRATPPSVRTLRAFSWCSILATPVEGAKMLVCPSSHRTRKRGGSWARTSSITPARPDSAARSDSTTILSSTRASIYRPPAIRSRQAKASAGRPALITSSAPGSVVASELGILDWCEAHCVRGCRWPHPASG